MREEIQQKVPDDQRQSWYAVMFVWIGSMICLSSILCGSQLAIGLNFAASIIAGIIGYIIILIITILQGIQSSDLGRPTIVVAEPTFGIKGTRHLFSLLFSISLIGWFGIQAAIAGNTIVFFLNDFFNINANIEITTLIIGLLMLATSMYGFKAMEYLNYVSVPLMIIVIFNSVIKSVQANDMSMLWQYQPSQTTSLSTGIGFVVGGFIVGALLAGDFTRFNKTRNDTIKSATLGIVPAGIILIIVGVILGIFTGEEDITLALVKYSSFPLLVYIMLILGTWTTNVTNAYSAGIAIVNGLNLDKKYRGLATFVSGIIGTLLAIIGILDNFELFLIILTNLLAPISGVMIADYWIKHHGKAHGFMEKKPHSKFAIIAWAIGCIPGTIVTEPFSNFMPSFIIDNGLFVGISTFSGIFIAMITYLLLINFKQGVEDETINEDYLR